MTQRTAWTLGILVISIGYVLAEIVFNAMLVTTAGGKNLTAETLHNVELFGRTMAGIGLTVVVGDALTSAKWCEGLQRKAGVFALVALVCWPLMFFGQKALIDSALVEPSSAEARQRAYFSSLLRSALANETVQIKGLSFDGGASNEPQAQTFLTLFGGLIYADASLVERLEDQRSAILREFIVQRVNEDLDKHWREYREAQQQFVARYKEYRSGSRRFASERARIPERQAEARETVSDRVHSGWKRYQALTRAHNARRRARAEEVAEIATEYFDDVGDDCSERCLEWAREDYDEDMADLELDDYPPKFWLIREDVTAGENVGKSLITAALTGGVSAAVQLLDVAKGGDGGWKDEKFLYTDSAAHYAERLKGPMAEQFVEESGGYEPGIESLNAFRRHEETAEKVRTAIAREHPELDLPADWNAADLKRLDEAVREQVIAESARVWDKRMGEKGMDVPPGLSFGDFQRHPDVQVKIRERMGERYVEPTLMDWEQDEFYRYVLEPAIDREVEKQLTRLDAATPKFADGGPYAEAGQNALRAVLVPPIAMILSLFFVLLTIFKLPLRFAGLLARPSEHEPSRGQRRAKRGLKAAAVVFALTLLVAGPLVFASSDYTDEPQGPVEHLLARVAENAEPTIAYAMRWALHAQPLMLPVGTGLEDALGIYAWFSRNNAVIATLSKAYTGAGDSHGASASATRITTTTLNVRARPANSAERIGRLPPGTPVAVLREVGDGPWVEIRRGQASAFIHGDYLER